MSHNLGRDVPELAKLCAGRLWADFSFPIETRSRFGVIEGTWVHHIASDGAANEIAISFATLTIR